MSDINRRDLRAKVMQALYAQELSKDSITHLHQTILAEITETSAGFNYASKMLNSVINKSDEINELITKHTTNWDMNRIAIIDIVLLRMGIAEFLYFPDIPPKVTINEMIEIAKDYSTDNSGKFVNGILDAVFLELKSAGRMVKEGRGLVESAKSDSTPKK
jgi:N utilization substance protein B